MKKIKLYDILTLSDNKEYAILRMLDLDEKKYYLLSEIDKEENPILNNIKIVEHQSNDTLIEIEDNNKLTELKELFISATEAKI